MNFSPSLSFYSDESKPFVISTTGISSIEISLFKSNTKFIISEFLTPSTQILVTYRAIFTKKYIQALKWAIPIVSIKFLYDFNSNFKKYLLRPFEGSTFSSSGIENEIYLNYFILQGSHYESNVSILIDFLICDNEESEKYIFCKKYGIPILKTTDVFLNNYDLFLKKERHDAKCLAPESFFHLNTFYLDPNLPKSLFNKLRRTIVENDGTRVSILNDDIEFIFSNIHDCQDCFRTYHYQYVFDCIESKAILYPQFYKVHFAEERQILKGIVAVVDKSLGNNGLELINKLKSLGATVKTEIDMRTTHFITNRRKKIENKINDQIGSKNSLHEEIYLSVLPEWVDQCLTLLKFVKELKFLSNTKKLGIKNIIEENSAPCEEMVFQFTSLPQIYKNKVIEKLDKYGLKYSEKSSYDNCTHLIMGEFNLSEKFFGALLNGRWILRLDFIDDFENQTGFNFAKYEWQVTSETRSKDAKKIISIKKWREKIQQGGKKPFYKWKVKLYSDEKKREKLEKLISYGGGNLTDKGDYTHVFVSEDYKEKVEEKDFFNTDYIFMHLFK